MKATALLKKQHRVVEGLFARLERGNGNSAATLTELGDNLVAHMTIEQEIFYPTAEAIDDSLISESLEEHSLAEIGLKRLLNTDPKDHAFSARVKALEELISHHVKEEETELFPKVDAALRSEESRNMEREMEARFGEVLESGHEAMLTKSVAKTTADASRTKKGAKAHPHPEHVTARH